MPRKYRKYLSLILLITGLISIYFGAHDEKKEIPAVNVEPKQVLSETITATNSATQSANIIGVEQGLVTRVVDGDTIEVEIAGIKHKLRYIGINTPETVDPRRGVQCFGHEASDENKRLVEGKNVILTKDFSETDKYDRLLRFVYLPIENDQLLFVNDYLVREGYAFSYTYPPDVKFSEQFTKAQAEAQLQKKGLWNKCK